MSFLFCVFSPFFFSFFLILFFCFSFFCFFLFLFSPSFFSFSFFFLLLRGHDKDEDERRCQEERMGEGKMTAAGELKIVLEMAERHAQAMCEHREMVEVQAQKKISAVRERTTEGMGEMIGKGYGKLKFGSEEITPKKYVERMKKTETSTTTEVADKSKAASTNVDEMTGARARRGQAKRGGGTCVAEALNGGQTRGGGQEAAGGGQREQGQEGDGGREDAEQGKGGGGDGGERASHG